MTSLMSRAVVFRTLPSTVTKCTAPCNAAFQLQRNRSTLPFATTAATLVPVGSDHSGRRRLSATSTPASYQPPPSPAARLPFHPLPSFNRVPKPHQHHAQFGAARRCLWQEVVRTRVDPDTGEVVWSENPMQAAARAERAEASERIDDRHKRYLYYEKPTSRRKRVAEAVHYRAKKTKVMELVRYIKFTDKADEDGEQGQKGKGTKGR